MNNIGLPLQQFFRELAADAKNGIEASIGSLGEQIARHRALVNITLDEDPGISQAFLWGTRGIDLSNFTYVTAIFASNGTIGNNFDASRFGYFAEIWDGTDWATRDFGQNPMNFYPVAGAATSGTFFGFAEQRFALVCQPGVFGKMRFVVRRPDAGGVSLNGKVSKVTLMCRSAV